MVVEKQGIEDWASVVADSYAVGEVAPETILVDNVLSEGNIVDSHNVLGSLAGDDLCAVAPQPPTEHTASVR
jgi:hypothetical protein